MQNQNLQQSYIESNAQANDITHIHFAENRHIMNGLVDVLKSSKHTTHNSYIAINSPNYARHFLWTLAEIDHRLN